ncbi:MAG: hypothetical protein MJE66_09845 [Proteobacteria bacterium]|nr:hypothetical protein [Pseudomonadota bacterium]
MHLHLVASAAALLSALVALSAGATTLTFDVNPLPVADNRIFSDYGNRVVDATTDASGTGAAAGGTYLVGAEGATPNVVVTHIATQGDSVLYTGGFGDLVNVSWRVGSVELVADPGVMITFESVDLACFGCADGSAGPSVALTDGSGTTYWDTGGNLVFADGSLHETVAPPSAVTASKIVLELDYLGSASTPGFVAIDNLRFSQSGVPVPEPGVASLLAIGAFALGRRRS